jgi:hypothetical protein
MYHHNNLAPAQAFADDASRRYLSDARRGESRQRRTVTRRSRVRRRGIAVTVPLLFLVAVASARATPMIKSDLPCYTPGQTIGLSGGGFGPDHDVVFFLTLTGEHGSRLLYTDPVKTDPVGALGTRLRAPNLASDNDAQEKITLTANDQTLMGPNGQNGVPEGSFAVTDVLLSRFGAFVDPWEQTRRGDPRRSAKIVVNGWAPYHAVWAHYFLNGVRVRSVRVGSVHGPCGDLSKTIKQFPFRPVPAGTWTVFFSPKQVFDRDGLWYRSKRFVVPKAKAVR